MSLSRCVPALAFAAALSAAAAQETPAVGAGPTMLSKAFTPEALEKARLREFEGLLDRAAASGDFVGLAVAVVRGGEIELVKTYGVLETGAPAPVTPETVFRIASMSKGFAATLAGLAVEEGKFAWTTPVSAYAPRFALSGGAQSRVTIEHILSHRVGLPPNAYDNLLEAGVPVADILPRFRSVKPICGVGACYAYQNITFNLIGDALAQSYGASYDELARSRLFAPLGMRTASLGADGLKATGNWARPHVRDRLPGADAAYTPWRSVEVKDAYYRAPAAGGVNASIMDMALWLKAQMGGAPETVPVSVLDAIHAPRTQSRAETRRWRSLKTRIADTHYGFGWRVYDYAGHHLVNHSGGVEGYGAQIAFLPDRNVGIVVLANTRAERVWRIIPTFLDIELDLPEEDWLKLDEPPLLAGEEVDMLGGG